MAPPPQAAAVELPCPFSATVVPSFTRQQGSAPATYTRPPRPVRPRKKEHGHENDSPPADYVIYCDDDHPECRSARVAFGNGR